MAKTFDFNAIKGIRLVDKTGKVKDETVKAKLGDQNIFRFKEDIVWAKPFKLYLPKIPVDPTPVRVQINRLTTKRSLVETGQIFYIDTSKETQTVNELDVYYGDTLSITGESTDDLIDAPNVALSQYTVTGDVYATITSNGVAAFTLTIPTLPTGVKSLTVTRTSSPLANAELGELKNDEPIYFNDTLTIEAKPSTGYRSPILNETSVTVSGDYTVSVVAGEKYEWAVIIPPLQEGFSSFSVKNYVTDEEIFATDQEKVVEMGKDDHYGQGFVPYYDYYTSGNREYRVYVVYPDGFASRAGVLAGDDIGGSIGLNEKYNIAKVYLMPPNATMGTIVGYPQTRDYVDTIYFNTALSKEKVKQIVDRVMGLYSFGYEHLFYSGGLLPMTITIYFDGNGEFEIRGKFTVSGSTVTQYTYFDSINGWNSSFEGSIQVEADPQDVIPSGTESGFPEPVGIYNESLTELMSATSEFDDFSQVKWD